MEPMFGNRPGGRRSIRKKDRDHAYPAAYFVTLCVQGRQCLFGEVIDDQCVLNTYGRVANQEWHWLQVAYWYISLGPWVVMPNHVHGVVRILMPGMR